MTDAARRWGAGLALLGAAVAAAGTLGPLYRGVATDTGESLWQALGRSVPGAAWALGGLLAVVSGALAAVVVVVVVVVATTARTERPPDRRVRPALAVAGLGAAVVTIGGGLAILAAGAVPSWRTTLVSQVGFSFYAAIGQSGRPPLPSALTPAVPAGGLGVLLAGAAVAAIGVCVLAAGRGTARAAADPRPRRPAPRAGAPYAPLLASLGVVAAVLGSVLIPFRAGPVVDAGREFLASWPVRTTAWHGVVAPLAVVLVAAAGLPGLPPDRVRAVPVATVAGAGAFAVLVTGLLRLPRPRHGDISLDAHGWVAPDPVMLGPGYWLMVAGAALVLSAALLRLPRPAATGTGGPGTGESAPDPLPVL